MVAELGRERDKIIAKKRTLALRLIDLHVPADFMDVLRETAREFSNQRQEVEKKLERAHRARDASQAAWGRTRQIIEETAIFPGHGINPILRSRTSSSSTGWSSRRMFDAGD